MKIEDRYPPLNRCWDTIPNTSPETVSFAIVTLKFQSTEQVNPNSLRSQPKLNRIKLFCCLLWCLNNRPTPRIGDNTHRVMGTKTSKSFLHYHWRSIIECGKYPSRATLGREPHYFHSNVFSRKKFSPHKGWVQCACGKRIKVVIETGLVNLRVCFVCLHFESEVEVRESKRSCRQKKVWTPTSTTTHPQPSTTNRQTTTAIDRYPYANISCDNYSSKRLCLNLGKRGKSSDRPFVGSETIVHVQQQHFLCLFACLFDGILE